MWISTGIFFLRCSYGYTTVTVIWQRNMNVCNVICTKWRIHQCTFSATVWSLNSYFFRLLFFVLHWANMVCLDKTQNHPTPAGSRNANHTQQWSYIEWQHKQGLQGTVDQILSAKIIQETNLVCKQAHQFTITSLEESVQIQFGIQSHHARLRHHSICTSKSQRKLCMMSPLCDVFSREPMHLLKIPLEQLYKNPLLHVGVF